MVVSQPENKSLDYIIDVKFRIINRLFFLSFKASENDPPRISFDMYCDKWVKVSFTSNFMFNDGSLLNYSYLFSFNNYDRKRKDNFNLYIEENRRNKKLFHKGDQIKWFNV